MLILRNEQDLPVSIRHVSHLITNAQVDIRVAIMEDTTVPSRIRTAFSETALVHQGLANKLHKIGELDSFNINTYRKRILILEQMYQEGHRNLIRIANDKLPKNSELRDTLLPLLIKEAERQWFDEIQVSSSYRMERIQALLDAKSLSQVTSILPIDGWTPYDFVKEALQDIRFGSVLVTEYNKVPTKETSFEKFIDMNEKTFMEMLKLRVIHEMTEIFLPSMKSEYHKLFVPNDDVEILNANCPEIIKAAASRGAGAKLIKEFFESEVNRVREYLEQQ